MTFPSIEPVLPATCGECVACQQIHGRFGKCKYNDGFKVVPLSCAPPADCPLRPRTEKPLPTSGGGERAAKWIEEQERMEA